MLLLLNVDADADDDEMPYSSSLRTILLYTAIYAEFSRLIFDIH